MKSLIEQIEKIEEEFDSEVCHENHCDFINSNGNNRCNCVVADSKRFLHQSIIRVLSEVVKMNEVEKRKECPSHTPEYHECKACDVNEWNEALSKSSENINKLIEELK